MKRALAALFPLLWGCAADEAPLAGTAVDPDVLFEHSTFADAALERVIREVLDRPRGTLSETELGSVKTLDAGRLDIGDLDGIERLENLRVLRLNANAFTNLAPLTALQGLTSLDLAQNGIEDATALSQLGNLQVLVLSDNALENVEPLAGLTRLTQLDLDKNRIADLDPLRSLKLLRLLNFDDNFVSDISALDFLPSLRRVELSGNPIDPEILDGLRERGIQVSFYVPPLGIGDDILEKEIREAVGIPAGELSEANLLSIRILHLRGSVGSIRGIERLKNLNEFSVSGIRATLNDISPLTDLFRLRDVSIFNTELTSLQGFLRLRLLRRLRLDLNRIEDLTPLFQMNLLTELSLGNNQIRDVFPLRRLTRLQKLSLNGNEVRDLGPLDKMILIEELNFNDNQVGDLSFITRMQSLRILNCNNNLIEDISPLLELPALSRISMRGNPVNEAAREHAKTLVERGVRIIGNL